MSDSSQKAKNSQNQKKIKEQSSIKEKLHNAGLTFEKISKNYNIPSSTLRSAMSKPHAKAERAIAAALGTLPHLLWRTRYHASGQRRSPQDYDRVPTMAQRQKEQAA